MHFILNNSRATVLSLLIGLPCLLNNARANDFVLLDQNGEKHSALLLSSSARIDINQRLVFTELTQSFLNASSSFIAGEYVFPLPEGAAVDALSIKVGGRLIEAKLKEKQQAATDFQQAQTEGKRAALLTQERPNVFRMAVTNIPAGEAIEIRLSYLDEVHVDDGNYSLRLPTTHTPRYTPVVVSNNSQEQTQQSPLEEFLALAHHAPFVRGTDTGSLPDNPFSIDISLNTGFPVMELGSDTHPLDVQSSDASHHRIHFANRWEAMDRDLVIEWRQDNPAVVPALFAESVTTDAAPLQSDDQSRAQDPPDAEHYVMLSLTPTAEHYQPTSLPKDVTFVIDTSGSMGGEPIHQAKAALQQGLSLLNAQDSFNIIEFNSTHTQLFTQPQPNNTQTLERARQFVDQLVADGGTQMATALMAALQSQRPQEERLQQLIFITDGAVDNEAQLSRLVHQSLGNTRLFSVGIGSAPNQHLFRQLSVHGRGTAINIENMQDVNSRMQRLFKKISAPAISDIELIDPSGALLEIQPETIPDLYHGEPLSLMLRSKNLSAELRIRAKVAGREIVLPINLQHAQSASGVAKRWAKQKMAVLMDKIHLHQGNAEAHTEAVKKLSLKHRVLSPFTSFIAVDHAPVRSPEQALASAAVASLYPKGTAFPQTALGTLPMTLLSLMSLLMAALLRSRLRQAP